MRFRALMVPLALSMACFAAAPAPATSPAPTILRGTLTQREGKPPSLELSDHKLIALDGDEPTRGILNDKRLAGADLETIGHFTGPQEFAVNPIYTKALHVHKNGKRLVITYWCSTCSIRTYTPGNCMCCQQETALDLQDDGKE